LASEQVLTNVPPSPLTRRSNDDLPSHVVIANSLHSRERFDPDAAPSALRPANPTREDIVEFASDQVQVADKIAVSRDASI
jgi:hypothetical protein